jgi:adenosylmethionine-8-amino-7-oxononanoate aminotransferase
MKTAKKKLSSSHIFYRNTHAKYPVISHGEGIYLFDNKGHRYIDGASGAAVVCLGHGHRRVIERLQEQAQKIAFCHLSAFSNEPVLEMSNELCKHTPEALNRVYFTSGGSEGVETAIKLARAYHVEGGQPQKFRIISRSISYHGSTIGALSMTGHHERRSKYLPMLIPFPRISTCYCYRCPYHLSPKSCHIECAWDLERAILADGPETIAAFIVEPVIGSSAPAVQPPKEYFRIIRKICKKHDVLLIADEVMSGMGRTGKFLAMQHYGVTPDISVISKGISSGYFPLGAVLVHRDVYKVIRHSRTGKFIHGNTFSGNPLACAVGLEVLRTISEEKMIDRVRDLGRYFESKLKKLKKHRFVGDIRCLGLLAGVEFVRSRKSRRPFFPDWKVSDLIGRRCLENGLYTYPGRGSMGNEAGDHILLAPPYIIREDQIDQLVDILDRSIGEVSAQLASRLDELKIKPEGKVISLNLARR